MLGNLFNDDAVLIISSVLYNPRLRLSKPILEAVFLWLTGIWYNQNIPAVSGLHRPKTYNPWVKRQQQCRITGKYLRMVSQKTCLMLKLSRVVDTMEKGLAGEWLQCGRLENTVQRIGAKTKHVLSKLEEIFTRHGTELGG